MKILRHFVDTSIIHIPESDRARPAPGLGLHVPVCEGFSFAYIGNIPRRPLRRNREAFKTHILGWGFWGWKWWKRPIQYMQIFEEWDKTFVTFVKHVFESSPSDVGHGDVVDIVPEVCVVPQRFTPCFIIRPLLVLSFWWGFWWKNLAIFICNFSDSSNIILPNFEYESVSNIYQWFITFTL